MPIVNGAYDAPTWNNNAPPAIDASELQDMCDTIETYNTQKADVDYVNTFVRPNLLDNAYFVGGGSQQNGGQFPINQRGKTSYSTSIAHTIDRWLLNAGNTMTCNIASDCVQLVRSGAGSYPAWLQIIETPEKYAGMKMTISALVKTSNGMPAQVDIKNTTGGGSAFASASITSSMTDWTLVSATGVFPENSTNLRVMLYVGNGTYSATLSIKAVKLELGSTQTLAHQENGVWVLNEIPNYQQELARCQRFQIAVRNFARLRVARVVSGQLDFFLPLPVTMNGAGGANNNPTLEDPSSILAVYNTGGTAQTGFTFSCSTNGANGVTIMAVKSSHGLTDGYLQFGSNTDSVIIDRNL